MADPQITMAEVRAKYPQYDDMSDLELANALHGRFYSDIPLGDFYTSIGLDADAALADDNGIYPDMRPGFEPQAIPGDMTGLPDASAIEQRVSGSVIDSPDVVERNGRMYARATLTPGQAAPQWAIDRVGGAENVNTAGFERAGFLPDQGENVWLVPIDGNVSQGGDLFRSAGAGIRSGFQGLAALPATARNLTHGLAEWQRENIWRKGLGIDPEQYQLPGVQQFNEAVSQAPRALPSYEQIDRSVSSVVGENYQPQTVAGGFARSIGEQVPNALVPGGVGVRLASVLVPGVGSEIGGIVGQQIDEAANRGAASSPVTGEPQQQSNVEPWLRTGGAILGGLGVGLGAAVQGGKNRVLANATQGVTREQLDMAAALRARSPVPLTNAEALQAVTGGSTGLGRVQRVVEGASNDLAPMMAARPEATQQALANVLEAISPAQSPQSVAGASQAAAENVLTTMRRRVNESAAPIYGQLPGQTISPDDLAALRANPSYAAAEAQLLGNPELAALLTGGADDLSTVNAVIRQLDTMEGQARPGLMNPMGDNTLAAQRAAAAGQARDVATSASPDFARARETVRTGNEAFVDPLKRGPIGAIANQAEMQPNLSGQTGALFPAAPFEGQAADTSQALRLLAEANPTVPPALLRQHLAQQGAEAMQDLSSGPNQFGGANFAARVAGNPNQRQTLLQSVDVAAPEAAPDVRALLEGLRATGFRERPGSNTAFNQELQRDLRGGNPAQTVASSATNPLGIPARISQTLDDVFARQNAQKIAQLLMDNPEAFNRAVASLSRGRGMTIPRTGLAALLSQGEE